MGTHLRVLRKSFPLNTNTIGFGWFFLKIFVSYALDEICLSIGRVKALLIGMTAIFVICSAFCLSSEEGKNRYEGRSLIVDHIGNLPMPVLTGDSEIIK